MVRIGFWGTGSATGVADWHAAACLQDKRANLTAVYNRTPARSERWAARYSRDIRVCRSEEELLESCDAVVICTPNYLHREQAEEALAAGRHVLLEKPLACSESEAQNLQDTARRNRVFGAVGYVYRFAGPVIRMRQILQEEFGSLYTVTARLGGIRLQTRRFPWNGVCVGNMPWPVRCMTWEAIWLIPQPLQQTKNLQAYFAARKPVFAAVRELPEQSRWKRMMQPC